MKLSYSIEDMKEHQFYYDLKEDLIKTYNKIIHEQMRSFTNENVKNLKIEDTDKELPMEKDLKLLYDFLINGEQAKKEYEEEVYYKEIMLLLSSFKGRFLVNFFVDDNYINWTKAFQTRIGSFLKLVQLKHELEAHNFADLKSLSLLVNIPQTKLGRKYDLFNHSSHRKHKQISVDKAKSICKKELPNIYRNY